MNPLSLRLKNFKGIRAGLGLDDIFLDLTKLPPGLVAIVGTNGSGKTTIMDNLHPYRLMPYKLRKAKDWSPNAFSYYDQCDGTEALKEFVFGMGEHTYRSLIMIDAERRKQECYLYRQNGGQWIPLNDGKSKTYDAEIENICGSPSLFFTSVFRSQGAKNLSDYTRSDILGIVSELLNIDHIREQGDKCRQVVTELAGRSTRLGAEIDAIAATLAGEAQVLAEESAIRGRMGDVETGLSASKKNLEDIQAKILHVQQQQKNRAVDEALLKELETAAESIRSERRQVLAEIEQKKESSRSRVAKLDDDYRAGGEVHSKEIAAITSEAEESGRRIGERLTLVTSKLERAQKIKDKAAEIRAKVAEEKETGGKLAEIKAAIPVIEAGRVELAEKAQRLQQLLRQQTEASGELTQYKQADAQRVKTLERELELAKNEAAKLKGIDCKADQSGWVNSSCRFVTDAVAARDRLPELEADIEKARIPGEATVKAEENLEQINRGLEQVPMADEVLAACDKDLAAMRAKVTSLEANLAEIFRWTKLVPDLERAEADIVELEAEAKAIGEEKAATNQRLDERRAAALQRRAAEVEKYKHARIEIDHDLQQSTEELQRKAAKLGDSYDATEAKVFNLRQTLAEDLEAVLVGFVAASGREKAAIETGESGLHDLQRELGKTLSKLEEFGRKRDQKAELEAKRSTLDAEAVNWKILAKACSNDGITALEIDDAGPTIAALANDLLNACYGPRFSVRLETQSEKRDGTMKEDFDIVVLDSETDEEVSITEKSGGQTTWIEDAITRAICLFNIHRSDRVFDSLFSDEKDGQLDAARKIEFLAVKRRAMELGTHRNEFFITQTPELVDMADGRIRLGGGKVEVV